MIEKLAQEQINKIPYYVEAFTKKGFETGKCDRNKVNNSINLCYEKAKLKHTEKIIWFDNPKNMIDYSINNIINNKVSNQVSNQVYQVYNKVWNQILAQVKSQVWDQVSNQVWDQVGDQVRGQVWNQIYNQVCNQVYYNINFGQNNPDLIAFCSFFENEFNLDVDFSILDGLKGMLDSGWWMPYEEVCLVSERPNIYRFTEYPKLGSLYKPAIEWDGFEIWINHVFEDILE